MALHWRENNEIDNIKNIHRLRENEVFEVEDIEEHRKNHRFATNMVNILNVLILFDVALVLKLKETVYYDPTPHFATIGIMTAADIYYMISGIKNMDKIDAYELKKQLMQGENDNKKTNIKVNLNNKSSSLNSIRAIRVKIGRYLDNQARELNSQEDDKQYGLQRGAPMKWL
jgi:hypothetical protein